MRLSVTRARDTKVSISVTSAPPHKLQPRHQTSSTPSKAAQHRKEVGGRSDRQPHSTSDGPLFCVEHNIVSTATVPRPPAPPHLHT